MKLLVLILRCYKTRPITVYRELLIGRSPVIVSSSLIVDWFGSEWAICMQTCMRHGKIHKPNLNPCNDNGGLLARMAHINHFRNGLHETVMYDQSLILGRFESHFRGDIFDINGRGDEATSSSRAPKILIGTWESIYKRRPRNCARPQVLWNTANC